MSLVPADPTFLSASFSTKTRELTVTYFGTVPVNVTNGRFAKSSAPRMGSRSYDLIGTWTGNPDTYAGKVPPFALATSVSEPMSSSIVKDEKGKEKLNFTAITVVVWAKNKPAGTELTVPIVIDPPLKPSALPPLPVKPDPSAKVLTPIEIGLPEGKWFVRIPTPFPDAASSANYEVSAYSDDPRLRIWRSGAKPGYEYWDISWVGYASGDWRATFNVSVTTYPTDKALVVVQPYDVYLGRAPQILVDLYDPDV